MIAQPDPVLPLILLQQSSVLLMSARWEESREVAWAAARAGAPEDAVLEILGVLELAESSPHAAVTALASMAGNIQHGEAVGVVSLGGASCQMTAAGASFSVGLARKAAIAAAEESCNGADEALRAFRSASERS